MQNRHDLAQEMLDSACSLVTKAFSGDRLTKEEKEHFAEALSLVQIVPAWRKVCIDELSVRMDKFLEAVGAGYRPESLKGFLDDPFEYVQKLVDKQDKMEKELLKPYQQHALMAKREQELKDTHEDLLKR